MGWPELKTEVKKEIDFKKNMLFVTDLESNVVALKKLALKEFTFNRHTDLVEINKLQLECNSTLQTPSP